MFCKRQELASIGNRVAGFKYCKLVLLDCESSFWDRNAFIKATALSSNVAVDIPIVLVASVETLLGPIFGIAELTKFCERLNLLTKNVRKLIRIHESALCGNRPKLSCHGDSFL